MDYFFLLANKLAGTHWSGIMKTAWQQAWKPVFFSSPITNCSTTRLYNVHWKINDVYLPTLINKTNNGILVCQSDPEGRCQSPLKAPLNCMSIRTRHDRWTLSARAECLNLPVYSRSSLAAFQIPACKFKTQMKKDNILGPWHFNKAYRKTEPDCAAF